jgi:soluble lytic murein transglycosylase-like protein
MKSTIKEAKVEPNITKTDEDISALPIKLPVTDRLENNDSSQKSNTKLEKTQQNAEVFQVIAESEPEGNELGKRENNSTDLEPEEAETLIVKLTKKYDLELPLILAVIEIESMFNPNDVSTAGAVGLMQLMPVTARELGLRVPRYKNPLNPIPNSRLDERFDPKENVEAGMKYLNDMIERYNNNYVLALCAYNAGPGRVDNTPPAIHETEKHVGKVLNRYYEYRNSPKKMREALEKLNAILGE